LAVAVLCAGASAARAEGAGAPVGSTRIAHGGRLLEVEWDAVTGAPRRIAAVGADLLEVKNADALGAREVGEIGLLLVRRYAGLLRVAPGQLVLKKVERAGGSWYVAYAQKVGGLEVAGSSLGFSIDPAGRIPSLGALLYPDARVPAGPRMGRGRALARAREHLARAGSGAVSLEEAREVLFPLRSAASVEYVRAFRFDLVPEGRQDPAAAAKGYAVFVDAASGRVVHAETRVRSFGCCLPADGEGDGAARGADRGAHSAGAHPAH